MEKVRTLTRNFEPTTKPKSGRRLFFFKLGTSLGLLVFLFFRMDLLSLCNIVVSASLYYLVIAAGALLTAKMVTAVRWALLARALGFKNSLGQFFLYYLFGMFFNLFVPSTVGGDAVRVLYLFRDRRENLADKWKTSVGRAVLSVAADRLTGGVVLVWIGAIALLAFPGYAITLPRPVRYSVWTIAVGCVMVWPLLWVAGSQLHFWRGVAWIRTLQDYITPYRTNPYLVLQTIFLSLIVHFLQTWIQILIGRSINLNIPWSYCFIFFPLVDILSMLPLSVSGLGLREGGYFYFLGKLGIGAEQSVACGMLWFSVVLFNGLLGGGAFLLHRKSAAAPYPERSPQVSV
jgi:uncharacterized membrane protein YbhN (UPF0104 family)